MLFLWILLGLAAILLLAAYICYRIVFRARPVPALGADEYDLPGGNVYVPYRDAMIAWQKETRQLPHQDFSIRSFDGLELWGKYYESIPGAPVELMFHGYRGTAERDLCGGVQRCFALGHNALIVDQRTGGRSGGRTITFGINEHRDCLAWVDFAVGHFGPDIKIILTGISMGAATVLMAAGTALPENVVGVLADCGYTSAREIIQKCSRDMGLPPALVYPFIRLGARLYGNFRLEETSPIQAIRNCTVPVIFFHGEADGFVPCDMSRANFDACPAPKRLVTAAGADHGMCYLVDPENYLKEAAEFFTENDVPTAITV